MQARAGAVVRPRPPRDRWELVYHERFVLAVREGETMTRGLGDAWLGAAAAALLATAPATTALAQEYPSKPVVIVVPAAAGGPTDTLARNLGVAMGSALGQQMIIDNSGGAGGIIGINKAAKSRPDGYTVLRSEEHTSELQSLTNLVCRLLLEKKKKTKKERDHSQ